MSVTLILCNKWTGSMWPSHYYWQRRSSLNTTSFWLLCLQVTSDLYMILVVCPIILTLYPLKYVSHELIDFIYDIITLERYEPRWKAYKKKRAFFACEPKPLPKKRRRRLSEVPAIRQPTSGLLTRLPTEIRLEIYRLVILAGTTHWHVVELRRIGGGRYARQPRNILCALKNRRAHPHDATIAAELATPHSHGNEILEWTLSTTFFHSDLAIAKTCRQIYLECIHIPYGMSSLLV